MHKIILENISHSYADKMVLDDFSFSFEQGKTTYLIGPSGCGKTTVLRLIAGLETPLQGIIRVNGTIVSHKGEVVVQPHLRKIGFVFQDLALWPHFTVYKNIAFGLKERKEKAIKEKVSALLEMFHIEDKAKKYPHQLSGGQKQMVAIARSLVLKPEILLMDEPLANIDVKLKEDILQHLKELQQKQDFTMVFVTHEHNESLDAADRILIMNAGKIEASGSKNDIIRSNNDFVKSFIKF